MAFPIDGNDFPCCFPWNMTISGQMAPGGPGRPARRIRGIHRQLPFQELLHFNRGPRWEVTQLEKGGISW